MYRLDLPTPVIIGLFVVGAVLLGFDVFLQKTGRVKASPAKRDGTFNIRLVALALIAVVCVVGLLVT